MDQQTTNFLLRVLDSNSDFFMTPFDYSKVTFKQNDVPIKLRCPTHGEFQVLPKMLLKRLDLCSQCNANRRWDALRSTLSEFVQKAKTVHGDKYDYSHITQYVNSKTKVPIECIKCSTVFYQKPHHHLGGKGCRYCKFSNLKDSSGYLYVMAKDSRCYKIGISNSPERRLYNLVRDTPFPLKPVRKFNTGTWSKAYELETTLHKHFSEFNIGYKGFHGCTEWFRLTPLQVQELFRMLELQGYLAEAF